MKFCSQCRKTPWPFLLALLLAGLIGFLTWMILPFLQFDETARLVLSGTMFIATTAILIYYMWSCMRRHCRHGHHRHAS